MKKITKTKTKKKLCIYTSLLISFFILPWVFKLIYYNVSFFNDNFGLGLLLCWWLIITVSAIMLIVEEI